MLEPTASAPHTDGVSAAPK